MQSYNMPILVIALADKICEKLCLKFLSVMRGAYRFLVLSLLAGPIGLCLATTASAADIASVVGPIGSGSWAVSCPGPQVAPTGTSQLTVCPGGGADCLHRVMINPTEFPRATCSDGTPGAFYVRPGSAGDEDRWVIHLQGGGRCDDYDSCLERWCGQQGALPYTANKMSSDWNADGVPDLATQVNGPGMASPNPANAFSTWTHVWAYYCSSDSWQGRASDVVFDNGAGSTFNLDARGHTILYAMRKMLRKRNPNPGWTADGGYVVNDIDDATEIVFTGTSAGAKGAISNADWFLSVFPDSDNSLVIDANFDVSDSVLIDEDVWVDWDNDGVGDELWYSGRIDFYNDQWAPGGYLAQIDAFTDETCRNWYEPLGRMDRCSQFSTMLRLNIGDPIIETPTFVRQDLEDSVISRQYVDHPNNKGFSLLIGGAAGTPITIADFTALMRASLYETYEDHDSMTGMFGPRCGNHVGLESLRPFAIQSTLVTTNTWPIGVLLGSAKTFHNTLWDWLNVGSGNRVGQRLIDIPTGAPLSGC